MIQGWFCSSCKLIGLVLFLRTKYWAKYLQWFKKNTQRKKLKISQNYTFYIFDIWRKYIWHARHKYAVDLAELSQIAWCVRRPDGSITGFVFRRIYHRWVSIIQSAATVRWQILKHSFVRLSVSLQKEDHILKHNEKPLFRSKGDTAGQHFIECDTTMRKRSHRCQKYFAANTLTFWLWRHFDKVWNDLPLSRRLFWILIFVVFASFVIIQFRFVVYICIFLKACNSCICLCNN